MRAFATVVMVGVIGLLMLQLWWPTPACAAQCELPRHMREVMHATRFVDSTGQRCFVDFYADDGELDAQPAERVQITCE